MPDNVKVLIEEWGLKGLGVGLMIGFVFEVFFIRNNAEKVMWSISVLSIVAMGMMGWISYDIAVSALPDSTWKPTVWTVGATANTWIMTRMVVSGRILSLGVQLLPKLIRNIFTIDEIKSGK